MPVSKAVGRTTRDYLKENTSDSHERLDVLLGALADNSGPGYADFLEIQWRARKGIEIWLEEACPEAAPPRQAHLIEQDLVALGLALPDDAPAFEMPRGADPAGLLWVLAGSSLGNRVILKRVLKTDAERPVAFLSDPEMVRFWHSLRPVLERSYSQVRDHALLVAARATFDHFHRVATDSRVLEPA